MDPPKFLIIDLPFDIAPRKLHICTASGKWNYTTGKNGRCLIPGLCRAKNTIFPGI
jgi:hypothetical protein